MVHTYIKSIQYMMRGVACASIALAMSAGHAFATIPNKRVRIGVLTDLSGIYEQNSGRGVVEAARMAAQEFGNNINGSPIEILAADHQNKPDIGVSVAARWFDVEHVDAIADLVNTAVGFAVLDLAKEKNKTVLLTSAGSADFTGKACAPDNSVHWVYDTYQVANAIGRAVPTLGKNWFFITADYAFGVALEAELARTIAQAGGTVVGSVRAPIGTKDFSSYVLRAQASHADVVAFNDGGDDSVNAMKAAREFGLVEGGQKIVAFGLNSLPIIKSTGLDIAQGSMYVTPWWPQLNPEAVTFTKKFIERTKTAPSPFQVGTYSAVRSYLAAVKATDSVDPKVVINAMKKAIVNDAFAVNGVLRPDGRMVHDVYIVQIKSPSESSGEWDLIKLVATIPGDQAFRSIQDGHCLALTK